MTSQEFDLGMCREIEHMAKGKMETLLKVVRLDIWVSVLNSTI